jgi:HNH endonuclease
MTRPRRTIPPGVRFRVLARSGFCCVYCGASSPSVELVIDHVLPVSLGGSDDESNLAASCVVCNQGKGASNVVAARATFLGWLRVQRGREDMIGDLADNEEKSPIPTEPESYKALARVFRDRGASYGALRASWHAWREWKRGGRMTRTVRKIYKDNQREIRENATNGACLWLKRGFWVSGKFHPYTFDAQ